MVDESRMIDLGVPDLIDIKLPIEAAQALRDWRDRFEAIERTRDALLASSQRYSRLLRQRNRQLLAARRLIAELQAPRRGWEQYARANGLPIKSDIRTQDAPATGSF